MKVMQTLHQLFKVMNDKILSNEYTIPKYVENADHLDSKKILKSIEYKLNTIYYFNTQLIGKTQEITDLLLKQANDLIKKKDNTTELLIETTISPTLLAIYFDSLILHLASLFDISSKLIQFFYPNCKPRTVNKLQESLQKNYSDKLITQIVKKNWDNWIEIIYDHRVLIYHNFYAEPDHKYKVRIDSLNNVKVDFFKLPKELQDKLNDPINDDLVTFSKEIIMLSENFLLNIIQIIKYEVLKIRVPIVRIGGEIMTKENGLHVFRDGDVAKSKDINGNFDFLLRKIKSLEEELVELKGKKVIE